MKFLFEKSVLIHRKTLVLADLHIGVEKDFLKRGIKIPSMALKMANEIKNVAEAEGTENILILGDLKHRIAGFGKYEEKEIRAFINALEGFKLTLVKGNHDARIENALDGNMRIVRDGVSIGNCYFCHGHKWPERNALEARTWVFGHEHPAVELSSGSYLSLKKVWLFGEMKQEAIKKMYSLSKKINIIVIPAFSFLLTGFPVNRRHIGRGPLLRASKKEGVEVIDENGTLLGNLEDIIS